MGRELAHFKAASAAAQLQQAVQSGHALTLEDICVLAQFWRLDVKADVLRASNLTLQGLLGSNPLALRRRLTCNYGTAVALATFLHKLSDGAVLVPPRTGCSDRLDSMLEQANCLALKPVFEAEAIADDVLFEINLSVLGGVHDEIADQLDALQLAFQASHANNQGLLVPAESGQLLLRSE
eukprot:m.132278 g.132278  ORF g.132278 m.132278 type:complete len:181 (-) comp52381_c0_seq2:74-616(-)